MFPSILWSLCILRLYFKATKGYWSGSFLDTGATPFTARNRRACLWSSWLSFVSSLFFSFFWFLCCFFSWPTRFRAYSTRGSIRVTNDAPNSSKNSNLYAWFLFAAVSLFQLLCSMFVPWRILDFCIDLMSSLHFLPFYCTIWCVFSHIHRGKLSQGTVCTYGI